MKQLIPPPPISCTVPEELEKASDASIVKGPFATPAGRESSCPSTRKGAPGLSAGILYSDLYVEPETPGPSFRK